MRDTIRDDQWETVFHLKRELKARCEFIEKLERENTKLQEQNDFYIKRWKETMLEVMRLKGWIEGLRIGYSEGI